MTVDRSAPLVVRVAGLPAATLSRLRFTETTALAEALVSTRQWLAAEAMALSASLFGVIGAAARIRGETGAGRVAPRSR